MRRRRKNKWIGFFLGMIVYALTVLLLASVGLKFLWDFADEHEKELPEHRMTAYVASLNEKHVRKIAFDFVNSLDRSIQSEEDSYAEIWRCFVGGVQYRVLPSENGDTSISYMILNKDHVLGKVTLTKRGDQLGEKTWAVTGEEYDFSFLLQSERFVVPEHWVVKCGERRLGVQYIVNPRVEYSFLADFYGKSFPMPYLAEYEISNYVGDPRIRFFDADGEEHPRFTFTDGKEQMLRANGHSSQNITAFAETFVPLYVNCLSNVNKSAGTNYNRIKPYLIPNGELDQRLKAAMSGQSFAQSNATDISDVRIHEIFNLENEYFIVDLSYSVDTYSDKGVSTSETNMLLCLYREEDNYRAQMVVLY